jgi:tryptophan aminotransferase
LHELGALRELTTTSAGKPNPTTFPFTSITLQLKSPLASRLPGSDGAGDGYGAASQTVTIEGPDLDDALQYGPSPGMTALRSWLADMQSTVHEREQDGTWGVSMGTGSQDLMYKVGVGVHLVA